MPGSKVTVCPLLLQGSGRREEEEDGRVCAQRRVSELQREEEEAQSGAAVQDR